MAALRGGLVNSHHRLKAETRALAQLARADEVIEYAEICCTAYVALWHIATLCGNAAIRSLSERSGHWLSCAYRKRIHENTPWANHLPECGRLAFGMGMSPVM